MSNDSLFKHNPNHTHQWGQWGYDDSRNSWLRIRYCLYEDCHASQYGVFSNKGDLNKIVTDQQVESYFAEVEQAQREHQHERIRLEHQYHTGLLESHEKLQRDLLTAKIRLTGGLG